MKIFDKPVPNPLTLTMKCLNDCLDILVHDLCDVVFCHPSADGRCRILCYSIWLCMVMYQSLVALEPRLVWLMAVVGDLFVSSVVFIDASVSSTVLVRACPPLGLFRYFSAYSTPVPILFFGWILSAVGSLQYGFFLLQPPLFQR